MLAKGAWSGKIRKLPLQDAAQETARRRRWLAKNNAGPHKKVNHERKLSKLADVDGRTLKKKKNDKITSKKVTDAGINF